MNELTFEERSLTALYQRSSRAATVEALREMRGYLETEPEELRALTDAALSKLESMGEAEFAALDLALDYDMEDPAYGE